MFLFGLREGRGTLMTVSREQKLVKSISEWKGAKTFERFGVVRNSPVVLCYPGVTERFHSNNVSTWLHLNKET